MSKCRKTIYGAYFFFRRIAGIERYWYCQEYLQENELKILNNLVSGYFDTEVLFNIFGESNYEEFYLRNCIDKPLCVIKPNQRDIVEHVRAERMINGM